MSDQEKPGTRGAGPQDPQADDPVIHSSLSRPLYLWSALLVLSLAWGLYDEMYGIRPWKSYEARFEKLYSRYLTELRTPESQREQTIKASPEYRRLDSELQAAEKAAMPEASAAAAFSASFSAESSRLYSGEDFNCFSNCPSPRRALARYLL